MEGVENKGATRFSWKKKKQKGKKEGKKNQSRLTKKTGEGGEMGKGKLGVGARLTANEEKKEQKNREGLSKEKEEAPDRGRATREELAGTQRTPGGKWKKSAAGGRRKRVNVSPEIRSKGTQKER